MNQGAERLESGAPYARRLAETLPRVRQRMVKAAEAAGRDPGSVVLVAVTKGHPVEAVQAAMAAGLRDLGENRVEELEGKVERVGRLGVRWHMIGHLQSRKAPRAAAVADLIHSLDSVRLAERLSRVAQDAELDIRALVQVNTSGEASKSGFDPEEALERILRMTALPRLRLEGLMTMAPFVDDTQVLSSAFGRLREVSERARASGAPLGPELSMGMTNDMDVAIREGSTMVRIGTALFGERTR